jgi:Polyphosphate kinase 2 (PPK2)
MLSPRLLDRFLIAPGERVKLDELPTTYKGFDELNELRKDVLREKADKLLQESIDELASAQELLWASDDHAVLVVLQAMDAAGKDGIIKHVMSGVNPRSCEVVSFKEPSEEEVDHTFLWRAAKRTPERGRIGIFNRSHYEDVLVVRVHPELLDRAKLPGESGAGSSGRPASRTSTRSSGTFIETAPSFGSSSSTSRRKSRRSGSSSVSRIPKSSGNSRSAIWRRGVTGTTT